MAGRAKFQNANAGSILVGGITAGATSLVVADATKFSPDGAFDLLIDSEYITVPVGGVSGATFSNLIRGVGGSSAASHSNSATVTQVVTANQAFQLWPNFVLIATKVGNYSANPQEFIPCNSSAGNFTITLPTALSAGYNCPIAVCDLVSGFGVSVAPSGGDTLPAAWSANVQLQTMVYLSDGVSKWLPWGHG